MTYSTNQFYDFITSLFDDYVVYREKAATTAVTPYIVIKFDQQIDTYPTLDQPITIVIYESEGKSLRKISDIADSVVVKLNNNVLCNDNQIYHFLLSMRQKIDSTMLVSKEAIELQFNVRVYMQRKEF